MAVPIPNLNLNSTANSAAKTGDTNFAGNSGFSVNFGNQTTGTPPWVWLAAALAALLLARKLHKG